MSQEVSLDPKEWLVRKSLDRMLEGLQIIGRDWRYLYLNQKACEQGRKPLEELLGKTMMDAFPGIDRTPLFETLKICMEQGEVRTIENEFMYPDGKKGWFEVAVEPVEVGVLIRTLDITERKRAEEANLRYAQELEESNAALEQYAFVAAHDLRAPLRQIASFVQLMEEELKGQGTPKLHEYMDYVSKASSRLQTLVRDLLNYSSLKNQKPQYERVDLEVLLSDILKDLEEVQHFSRTQITWDSLPVIESNKNLMSHAFQNLIENAVKFSSEEKTPKVHISCEETPEMWKIYFDDNGIGVDSIFLENLFKLFQRGHSSDRFPGKGIGLATCRRILKIYGGDLEYINRDAKGSRFCVHFPKKKKEST